MEKQPPSLFYYGDENLLSQLKKGQFELLNDWSMLQPYISFAQYQQSLQHVISEAELMQGFQLEYQRLPENIRALLSFDDFLQQRDKIEPSVRQSILAQRSNTADSPKDYPLNRLEQTVFLRLFSSATVHDAWQNMASGFAGFCLEINSKAACFSSQAGKPALLRPVRYGKPHELVASKANPVPGVFEDTAEHKAQAEWRFVRPANQGNELKLSKGDVVNVYVSIHTPVDVVARLRDLTALDLRFRHCSLFEIYPDASTWRLTARPI